MTLAVILLTAFINLLLGIISYKKQPNSATHRLLTALTVIFALWTVANYFSLNSSSADATLFWIRAVMFITAPLGPVLYLFIRAFPHSQLNVSKKLLSILTILTLFVMAIAFTPFIFSGVTIADQITPTPAPGIALFALLFMGLPIIGIYEIIKKYKKALGVERQQLKFLVFGISLTFILLILTNFVFVVLFKMSDLVIFGPIFSLIFVGFIFYAIVKHRLLAIRFIIARSVAYTFLIAVLASIYTFGAFFISRYIFSEENIMQQRFTSAILVVFLVLTFEPIKTAVQKATDRVFFHGKYNSDELILALTTITASTFKLKILTTATMQKLFSTLHIDKGAFIINRKQHKFSVITEGYGRAPQFNKETIDQLFALKRMLILDEEKDKNVKQMMHKLGIAIAVPLTEREQTEGMLLLGNKKSGAIYTPQDIKVLEIFGPLISVAIQNAKSYEAVKSFNKTLSDKITIATKELQESHEKLKTLDRQKDKFLGMASHELKTPITSIKAFTQVLYRRVDKEKHQDYASLLENINTQTDKVTKLINDLLNVSNIEEGKLVLKKEMFDANALVAKTISDIQYTTDTHQIIKEGKIKSPVFGDADRIAQVIANLLTNAIKYSPKADKLVVKLAEDKTNAIFSVQDFGPGIDKADMEKVFERFYRTKEHEERNIAGFGLGLYIASEIVKRHKGEIWATSKKGKGATFHFTIPLYNETR